MYSRVFIDSGAHGDAAIWFCGRLGGNDAVAGGIEMGLLRLRFFGGKEGIGAGGLGYPCAIVPPLQEV